MLEDLTNHPRHQDDYWQSEQYLARLSLPSLPEGKDVFFLWHESRENYPKNHREIGLKLSRAGERDYVQVKACYYVPRLTLSVSLTPEEEKETGDEIGHVTDVRNEGSDRQFIASLQAWYYAAEKTLMLWDVDVFLRQQKPTEDFLLSTFWHYFEEGLLRRFPDCERIITPGSDPNYSGSLWRVFLSGRGLTLPSGFLTLHKRPLRNWPAYAVNGKCGAPGSILSYRRCVNGVRGASMTF